MFIVRDNKEIKLTNEEVYEAHKEFIINWMTTTCEEIIKDFDLQATDSEIETISNTAYDIYCEGNGETEYECCEKAVHRFMN